MWCSIYTCITKAFAIRKPLYFDYVCPRAFMHIFNVLICNCICIMKQTLETLAKVKHWKLVNLSEVTLPLTPN